MFFIARSAVCIGIVIAALPGRPPAGRDVASLDRLAGQSGQAVIDRFCRESPARCLDVLGRMTLASRDTLSASDRLPRWAGPALASID